MLNPEFIQIIASIAVGGVLAAGLVMVWMRINAPTLQTARTLLREAEDSIAFLFDDQTLVDATPRARALLKHSDSRRTDWDNMLTLLAPRFPHLRSQCKTLADVGKKTVLPNDGAPGVIEAEYWNGLARITLNQEQDSALEILDPLTATAMEHELNTLRSIGENSPQLIWKRDAEGVLTWANKAYIELSEAIHPISDIDIRLWPPKDIFRDIVSPAGTAPVIDMHKIDVPGAERPIWYEVTSLKRGSETMYFAADASAVVTAQDAQRNFVQTLTKTFAQLSVGLAIFDSDRRLVLFNPALVDLTELPTDFLIGRPALFAFLDRLRDTNMIPEPRNYASWREQMVALENAAEKGNYQETWLLGSGQTFRVTGKPHPNGAIAFLFEDISDEVSLNRKFQAQIETTTFALDQLPTSVALFSANGSLILANQSYRALWGHSSEGIVGAIDFRDELKTWTSATAPSPVWIKLQDLFVQKATETEWTGRIEFDNYLEMTCHYKRGTDGNHMVCFLPNEINGQAHQTLSSDSGINQRSATG